MPRPWADPDRAEADDPEGAARQLEADEALLAGLDGPVKGGALLLQLLGEGPGLAQVARGQQHAGEHEFLDGIGVGAGSVEDRYAPPRQLRHRDVVHAGTGPGNGQHRRRDRDVVQLCRPHDDGVGGADVGRHLVGRLRQAPQSLDGDAVERPDPERHGQARARDQPCRRAKSAMNAASAATPDSGMAL
jgi:hypothetical protein